MNTMKKNKVSASKVSFVPLESIVDHKDIPYRPLNKEFVSSLSDDIAFNGLDVPLTTWGGGVEQEVISRKGEKTDARFILAGRHRKAALAMLRAADSAKFDKLFPNGVPVRHMLCSRSDALCALLRENIQRRDMSAEEIFPLLKDLVETEKLNQSQIAKRIGRTKSWVSQHIAIEEELPPEVADEVRSGKIDLQDARKMAQDVRKAKKAGKPLAAGEISMRAEAAKQKKSLKVASGRERSEKRYSLKECYQRYKSLTKIPIGRSKQILEAIIEYALKDSDAIPDEIVKEIEAEAQQKEADAKAKAEAKAKAKEDRIAAKKNKKTTKSLGNGTRKRKAKVVDADEEGDE